MHSQEINEIAAALAKAQGEMESAKKTSQNPFYHSKYADLAAVWDVIRKPLSANGLAVTQTMERVLVGDAQGTELFLRTMLVHQSGQWIDSYHPLPTIGDKAFVTVKDKRTDEPKQIEITIGPQHFGSALTYARRYSLSAIVGIASDEDDDATEASKAEVAPRKPEVARPVPLTEAEKEDIKFYTKELDSERLQKFLVWLNVKSIDQIGKHQYDRAISALKKTVGESLGTPAKVESSTESVGD